MVSINGVQFDLYNYQKTQNGVRLTINGSTTSALEEVIGNAADIVISDEYRGFGMKVASVFKKYGAQVQHEIDFINPSLEQAVQENAAELEIQAGAIAELAELITGGDEPASEA